MHRILIWFAVLMMAACSVNASHAPDAGGGGDAGGATSTGGAGGDGGAAATCAEWDYPAGEPMAAPCPEERDRCTHPSFGAMTVPACCPPDAPCAAPAVGPGQCDPMLGVFLGWCCLPACD